jgi:hypothetical protein
MRDSLASFLKDYGRMLAIAAAAVLGILALFLLVKTYAAYKEAQGYNYNTITIEGTGRAETPPTIAELSFTVQETASTVAGAQEAATARMTAALDSLQALEIENDDIRTAGYTINPQYANQPCYPGMGCPTATPTVTGYQVSQSVTVKVRNPDQAGPALEALGTAGVQNLSGPNFRVDDDSEVMAEARGKAIEDAHEKARELAKQLGVRLGDVVSFNEGGAGYPVPYEGYGGMGMDMAMDRSAAVPLPQGVNESEVTVMVTYKIK